MAWNWYAVKSLYRSCAVGRPVAVDRYYDPDATLVEERVVLFRARSFDEAIRKAEAEGRAYAASYDHANRYGQQVRQEYLDTCTAFELSDPPGPGREIFSSTEVVSRTTTPAAICRAKMRIQRKNQAWRRTKFVDRRFAGAIGRRLR